MGSFDSNKENQDRCSKAQGQREKALQNGLEQPIFKDFVVTVSSYHGGDISKQFYLFISWLIVATHGD